MDLQRSLRREDDARAAAHVNRLTQRVAGENARPRADDDDVGGAIEIEGAADAERRLGIRGRDHGARAAALEDEIEPRRSAYGGRRAMVARGTDHWLSRKIAAV